MQIRVTDNIKGIRKNLNIVEKSILPLATAKALTFTAERAKKRIDALIPQVFDRPTRYTRKATRMQSASVKNPTAAVFFKDMAGGRPHYLQPHVDGGARRQKRSELRLGMWSAMGKDMKKNSFGNLTKGTYGKMLADVGVYSYSDAAGNTKRKKYGGTKKIKYFWKNVNGRRMIFFKSGGKRNPKITPALVETSKPTYRKRLRFYETVASVTKRQFPVLLRKSIDREVRKLKQPRVR